jgi:hypothetical protein
MPCGEPAPIALDRLGRTFYPCHDYPAEAQARAVITTKIGRNGGLKEWR